MPVPTGEPISPAPRPSAVWPRRLAASLLGASLAGLLAALFDAHWARAGAGAEAAPGLVATWLAGAGLIAPVALVVGLAVGVASLLLHPDEAPSVAALKRLARAGSGEERAERGARLLLGPVALLLWILLTARVALGSFESEAAPRASGVAIGLGAAGAAVVLGVLTLGGARALARHARERLPGPLVCGGVGGGVFVAVFALLIATGTVSGMGGELAMFGVFKRPELDLRAPGLLLLVAALAYALPGWVARLPAWIALAAALLPLGLVYHSMTRGLEERRLALAVERGAPLSRIAMKPLRRLTDRDRDGAARYFGGGDCNDADPAINPSADDVPQNGVDEDCSGADAESVVLEQAAAEPPKDAAAWVKSKLPEQLNVMILSIDAWRWDVAGFMGNANGRTPNLDRLAQRGVVFERAYAPASYTSKSIPPMLIGKYASETDRGWAHFNLISKEDTTLPQRLQAAGVRTLSVQGYWYFYKESHGFHRGWDVLDSSAAPKVMQLEGDKAITSEKLVDATIRLLSEAENTKAPFFLWTHYVDPHYDYSKHEGFDFGAKPRERYEGEIAFVDHHLGRLLDFLEQSELGKRTAVIITSDHGEAFGEHGMIRHGFEVWEPLVRVPLLVYVPGVTPHRIKPARGLIDLAPTVMELLQMPMPSGEGKDFFSGQSLLLDVLMPPGHEPADKIVFVDMAAGPNNAERQAFYEGNLKLIASGGRPLGLYDLQADPDEKNDLLDDETRSGKIVPRYKEFRRRLRTIKVKPIPK